MVIEAGEGSIRGGVLERLVPEVELALLERHEARRCEETLPGNYSECYVSMCSVVLLLYFRNHVFCPIGIFYNYLFIKVGVNSCVTVFHYCIAVVTIQIVHVNCVRGQNKYFYYYMYKIHSGYS